LGWARLRGPATVTAVTLAGIAAGGEVAGSVVAGRLAEGPTRTLVFVLAALLLGAAVLDTAGNTLFSGVVGRAEGRLRADLLHAALHQPLTALDELAVGEVLDRVDDDAAQVGHLLRRSGWNVLRAALRSVLAWVVAGLTWPVAWVALPLVGLAAFLVARPLAKVVARRKQAEEAAWSDHTAQLEEAVAGRDDVRSSLGQPHVVRQYAERARGVLDRVRATASASATVMLRTGLVLHLLLVALVLAGVVLVSGGRLSLGELVTLWLLATSFIGQLSHVANQLPELQAGLGALARIRLLLSAPQEPVGGAPLPAGPADVEVRGLDFAYPGGFALREVSLSIPAGTTCALVGRTGAGKSTLARFLSRAVEPPPGTVFVGGQDIVDTEVDELRRAVGVVTQRTELLAATLLENTTLFADLPRAAVADAYAALGLSQWVSSLPDGLDTRLGVGGTTLSAGEEQLVAFARLLVRDVSVVVLDEASARMDPQTEQRVTGAAERLLAGRTGVVIAHRLSTVARCDTVAVLDRGTVIQVGPRQQLAGEPGPFRDLLLAAGDVAAPTSGSALLSRRDHRRERESSAPARPSLPRAVWALLRAYPAWGFLGAVGFFVSVLLNAQGALTGWWWGRLVAGLDRGETPWSEAALLAGGLLLSPLAVAAAFSVYPLWWVSVTLRLRLAVLRGQTMQRRLQRTPPGEVAARALDSERLVLYADRWVDVWLSAATVLVAAVLARSALAAVVIGGVLVVSAAVSAAGAPLAGAAAREAGDERARFGRSLASALDAARTVKLAAATEAVQRHLEQVDSRRVAASVREHRVRTLLTGVPGVLAQAGVVAAWTAYLTGVWDLATALLVSTTVSGFGWFGVVAGAAVTEVPVARRWLQAAGELSGSRDLTSLPDGVDLTSGTAPAPLVPSRVPLQRLSLESVSAVHDDGTVGVENVDLQVPRGSLVLLAGRVGSGKSSLLSSLAGLVDHEGTIRWNDRDVDDPQLFLRPGQVAYVGQVPRVLSGSFADNITLGHAREIEGALETARLHIDVSDAGGHAALVGHRGVRLSGGQVQRLALARALATEAELLVADDVSSALDARTEVELWEALRRRGVTVVGASSKRSALERADCVVVLDNGRVAETGTWAELAPRWQHLAG